MGGINGNCCSCILESEQKASKNIIVLTNTKRIIKAAGAQPDLMAGFEHQAQFGENNCLLSADKC